MFQQDVYKICPVKFSTKSNCCFTHIVVEYIICWKVNRLLKQHQNEQSVAVSEPSAKRCKVAVQVLWLIHWIQLRQITRWVLVGQAHTNTCVVARLHASYVLSYLLLLHTSVFSFLPIFQCPYLPSDLHYPDGKIFFFFFAQTPIISLGSLQLSFIFHVLCDSMLFLFFSLSLFFFYF